MSDAARQIPLSFDHRPALDAEDFIVAPPNEAAVGWLDRWPDWPGRALAIFGPEGSGKTHLAHVWRHRSGARLIAASELSVARAADILGPGNRLVVEDADRGVDETALFHVMNMVREEAGSLLLTARQAPARWPVALPDLSSRLAALQVVELLAPDDDLLAAVLAKHFVDRQLKVADDVIGYLLPRMERSFKAVQRIAAALDRLSLAERRNITVPLARRVLDRVHDEGEEQAWTSD